MLTLEDTTARCRALADSTRVRLMALVRAHTLSVSEIAHVTQLPQPRVSSHLKVLREAGLVVPRRVGGSAFYQPTEGCEVVRAVLKAAQDPLLSQDRARAIEVVQARRSSRGWGDGVAGRMARSYSPGRTWESLARGLAVLANPGRVLDVASGDGAVAEILAPLSREVVCLDANPRVVDLGRERMGHVKNLRFVLGDMHELPFPDASFDTVLLMGALPHTAQPREALSEAARVLAPGGRLAVSTLRTHAHRSTAQEYDHLSEGMESSELAEILESLDLHLRFCEQTSRERRAPHFEVITAAAEKPL
ncbi:MAG: metalloregulator ArsR/SmtB family transcription factor [Myxococcota bacterium]|nr:metalloregulator ArsR/SmtB family transcription factor [Myxococcota bacterium]